MFDVIAENAVFIILALVVMWIVQFGMAYLQMKRFYGRLKVVRKGGLTAVGQGGGQYRGRAYAVLTIDDNNIIVHAEQFKGWTVFARLRPMPEIIGMSLQELLDNEDSLPTTAKLQHALGNAGRDLLAARQGKESESEATPVTPQLEPA
ncbi:MAG: hypothetical protein DHS20C20_00740 [Ardenticatenaceae bacterium]|nr:MAG: hypothetical protein DHS20C20_00740 [Ardenticatenaceae bacterium]